jgi:hypothetical protein
MVAVIQLAIALGSSIGGLLSDTSGYPPLPVMSSSTQNGIEPNRIVNNQRDDPSLA